MIYPKWGKRVFDLFFTILGIMLSGPLLAAVVLLGWREMGSPLLFMQQRPGKDGIPFTIYKFRTMTDERDPQGHLLPDDRRLTVFGRFLRSASIDELPALWNVLRGDMSLVGPRPILMEYLPLYNDFQRRRHEVCPGMTGWAQIKGRNELDWEEKFRRDVWYVDNYSLRLDLNILIHTVLKVLKREGISHPGHDTMKKFTGRTTPQTIADNKNGGGQAGVDSEC